MAMKVAIYARVSTSKQDELNQVPYLEELAKARGYHITAIYLDEASGKDSNRPGWNRMMEDEKFPFTHFDAILVTKLDRVMRSVVHLISVLEDLQSRNVVIISATDGVLDMSTAAGKLQLQILAAVAEWEREIISERTREALAVRKKKGIVGGRPKRELPLTKVAMMRHNGSTWRSIARETGVPESTLRSRRADIDAEIIRMYS